MLCFLETYIEIKNNLKQYLRGHFIVQGEGGGGFTKLFLQWKMTKISDKSADNQSEARISVAYYKNCHLSLMTSFVKRGPDGVTCLPREIKTTPKDAIQHKLLLHEKVTFGGRVKQNKTKQNQKSLALIMGSKTNSTFFFYIWHVFHVNVCTW